MQITELDDAYPLEVGRKLRHRDLDFLHAETVAAHGSSVARNHKWRRHCQLSGRHNQLTAFGLVFLGDAAGGESGNKI